MAVLAVSFLITLIIGTLVGHWIHWCLHQRWAGAFYKAHMVHHVKMYPRHDLRSARYRSTGKANGWFAFIPPVALVIFSIVWGLHKLGAGVAVCASVILFAALIGWAHGAVHDAFHVEGHWMSKLPGFAALRAKHDLHHRDMRRNLGILTFTWDRVFGSYRKH